MGYLNPRRCDIAKAATKICRTMGTSVVAVDVLVCHMTRTSGWHVKTSVLLFHLRSLYPQLPCGRFQVIKEHCDGS